LNLYCLAALASDRLRELREQATRARLAARPSRPRAIRVALGLALMRLGARTAGTAWKAAPTS
jgi:hypothetical protein